MENDPQKHIDDIDLNNQNNTFQTGELFRYLGFTRDTLRHYEAMGFLKPCHDQTNNYRQYGFDEIYKLLVIEFYKKRGFALAEINQLIANDQLIPLTANLVQKQTAIEQEIKKQQQLLKKLTDTQAFCLTLPQHLNQFSVMDFPLYEIVSSFSAISAFDEYQEKVLAHINLADEDLLSNMIRCVTFDATQYHDTEMHLVAPASHREIGKDYLDDGPCLHIVVESGRYSDATNQVIEKTRLAAYEWANKNQLRLTGTVYLHVRLILFHDNLEQAFVEAWAPIDRNN